MSGGGGCGWVIFKDENPMYARKKHRKIHLRSVRMGLADSKKEGPAFEACLLPRHEGTVLVSNIAAHFERSREGLNSYWSRETTDSKYPAK